MSSLGQFAANDPARPTLVGLQNRIKSRFSLARKIRELVQSGWTITRAVWAQDDLVRYSVQVDPKGYAETVRKVLNGLEAAGWSVPPEPAVDGSDHPDWRNAWVLGNRFHGLAVIITDPATGDRVEVQFPTPQSWDASSLTHQSYELFRDETLDAGLRVRALADILDVVKASGVDDSPPDGAESLGPRKPNGPETVLLRSRQLAADFLELTEDLQGQAFEYLVQGGITVATAERVVMAAQAAVAAPSTEPAHIGSTAQGQPDGSQSVDERITSAGFTPGQSALAALDEVMPPAQAQILWRGQDSTDNEAIVRLPDGSAIELTLGRTAYSLDEADRPLQSWAVDHVQLDDGPLTPAAARFLAELRTVVSLQQGQYEVPLQQWVMQRSTLNPLSHVIQEPGTARPLTPTGAWLVWDAAQGWVPASQVGSLARVQADRFVTAENLGQHETGQPMAGQVSARAATLISLMGQDVATTAASALYDASVDLTRASVRPAVSAVLQAPVEVLGEGFGHVVLEHPGGVAVVAVSPGETAALPGGRPGLDQVGTTARLGRLRNQFAVVAESERKLAAQHQQAGNATSQAQYQARYEYHHAVAVRLTNALRNQTVSHYVVRPVVTNSTFLGARITQFAVTPAQSAGAGTPRQHVEPYRYGDAGLHHRQRLAEATAGWVPGSFSERIRGSLERLTLINPDFAAFREGARNALPWGDNCGECSRAYPELLQGRTPRVAAGDNGARLGVGWPLHLTPGERSEMYEYQGVDQPTGLLAPGAVKWEGAPADSNQKRFTARAYRSVAAALAAYPVGSVATLGVGWHNPAAANPAVGGHWFNAVVTEDGLVWVDAQSAQYGPWPPPYPRQIWEIEGTVQLPDSDTWQAIDLRTEGGGSSGAIALGLLTIGSADAAFAARIANASGDWPDEEESLVGKPTATTSPTVTVRSPDGAERTIGVSWIDRGAGSAPVLVLRQLSGHDFWWSVPDAVLEAVRRAKDVVEPDRGRWAEAVVVGCRPTRSGHLRVTEFSVQHGVEGGLRLAGQPRTLGPDEAARAIEYLGLT